MYPLSFVFSMGLMTERASRSKGCDITIPWIQLVELSQDQSQVLGGRWGQTLKRGSLQGSGGGNGAVQSWQRGAGGGRCPGRTGGVEWWWELGAQVAQSWWTGAGDEEQRKWCGAEGVVQQGDITRHPSSSVRQAWCLQLCRGQ